MTKGRKPFLLLAPLIVFLSLCPADSSLIAHDNTDGTGEADVLSRLAHATIAMGTVSSYPCRIPTLIIVRDQAEWDLVWTLHQGAKATEQQLPEIDFTTWSLIALFSGNTSAIENIAILSVQLSGDAVAVSAGQVEPGKDCPGLRTVKNPFHIVRVPAIKEKTLPSLEIEVFSRQCGR